MDRLESMGIVWDRSWSLGIVWDSLLSFQYFWIFRYRLKSFGVDILERFRIYWNPLRSFGSFGIVKVNFLYRLGSFGLF